jgi:hypothetical protein
LRPGSHSEQHRAALAFIAQEYERLFQANDPECTDEAKQRLLDKAEKVRGLIER